MQGHWADLVIPAYNAKLGELQRSGFQETFSLTKFGTTGEEIIKRTDVQNVPELSTSTYTPSQGGTRLYQTQLERIMGLEAWVAGLSPEERPHEIHVLTFTDGADNQSWGSGRGRGGRGGRGGYRPDEAEGKQPKHHHVDSDIIRQISAMDYDTGVAKLQETKDRLGYVEGQKQIPHWYFELVALGDGARATGDAEKARGRHTSRQATGAADLQAAMQASNTQVFSRREQQRKAMGHGK